MEIIIGRNQEIETFKEAKNSGQSEFIAVTGRRRIGKTFLINSFFKEEICFYMTGAQSQPAKTQLRAFANELSIRTKRIISTPEGWLEAFAILRDYVETIKTTEKKVIFFDELNSNAYKTWCGLAFEWLCHLHKKEIVKALGIGGIQTIVSYLNIKDDAGKMTAQIDMLIDRADNALNLCEIKFSNDVYTLTKIEADTIRKKIYYLQGQLKRRKSIFPIMITTFGCEKNMHYLGLITNQLDMDCLF